MVYNILEIANTHGGNLHYLESLIDEFEGYSERVGMKFQPFKYDEIALKDFEWYPVYEELYFSPQEWAQIIKRAGRTKDIWLDIFDRYSVQILSENLADVHGLKLQASVLLNRRVTKALAELDLKDKKIMLNISGHELEDVRSILKDFEQELNCTNYVLQIGFQGYPTALKDSGLRKIAAVQNAFELPISFADHIEADDEDALWLPVFAATHGATIIEKHVKHSSMETKYDHYSSIDAQQFAIYFDRLHRYVALTQADFITDEERTYLKKSDQVPILTKDKAAGSFLTWEDVDFKRTNQEGITTATLKRILASRSCLSNDKYALSTLQETDFRKAKIATIIAVRLKSSRLPRKALAKIGELTSIEYCVKNALEFEGIDHTIVATSDLPSDSELKDYTYDPDRVVFHMGDPEDVINRYLEIIRKLNIDVVVRVTGDMPFISNDILQFLLESHFASGADYTVGNEAAVGTNLEIINTTALEEVQRHFPSADYSEYMTWYFQNNPEHFNLNFVDLPDSLIRSYRLTLDYEEDLEMFNRIDAHLKENGLSTAIHNVFHYLDNHPEVVALNNDIGLVYKTDQKLIDTLNEYTKIKS